MIDEERCYSAVQSRDPRFDGWFYTAVVTTGIYCRPSCPAMTPKRAHVTFFASPAAAHRAGFRACKRCRPDAAPGSPEWNMRADVVGRAMRLIGDGIVDREGVTGLSRRLGYSTRQLNRLLVAELGAGPLALARAQRAQAARVLLETTVLPIADIAHAVGFGSIRQFNDTVKEVFSQAPRQLRAAARGEDDYAGPGVIRLRLPYRAPLATTHLFAFLARRAAPGLEAGDGSSYRRAFASAHGSVTISVTAAGDHIACRLRLDDLRDLAPAVARARRLLDLDADPVAVDAHLASDPRLRPLVSARPGLRAPGCVDAEEMAIRAVAGQQASVAGARTIAATLAERYGDQMASAPEGITYRFPTAATLADVDPAGLPMPGARARALVGLAGALASGEIVLDPGADRGDIETRVQSIPGIGPWTAAYIRMRALGDPDVFVPADPSARRALAAFGPPSGSSNTAGIVEAWRPWRSYGLHHLWASAGPSTRSTIDELDRQIDR